MICIGWFNERYFVIYVSTFVSLRTSVIKKQEMPFSEDEGADGLNLLQLC